MKIVVATDSFKGTLSSLDICHLFTDALKDRNDVDLVCLPLADGGEGSLECVSTIKEGKYIDVTATDLYFNKIKTHFYIDKDNNAYIESCSCVGMSLVGKDNDPGKVTTYGLGEQIKEAIKLGANNIYIFLGGTASNDGGCGLASTLGTRFFNKDNEVFIPTGLTLKDIVRIDNSECEKTLKNIRITGLIDVKSPFFGISGAAYKYAKQKGASDKEVELLDEGLRHLSSVMFKDLRTDISLLPGAGAAGGLGGGLYSFCNASLSSGINTILDLIDFDKAIKDADMVVTGEGKLDRQTLDGKVIDGVAKRCEKYHVPLNIIVGMSELSIEEVKHIYPSVVHLYETNNNHLPFDEIKDKTREDYNKIINRMINEL